MKVKNILFFFLFIGNVICKAENEEPKYGLTYNSIIPDFQHLTPEASSLGKYGSYAASEYTGTPNINIPLFTLTSGTINVPIYLTYDASGIKVEQEATFVGLGWNLVYGGTISHLVNGQDEFQFPPRSTYEYYKNYIKEKFSTYDYYNHFCERNVIEDIEKREAIQTLEDIKNGHYVPDIFQASFCGHSVSFVLEGNSRAPIIIGDDATKYKIDCDVQGRLPESITITDDLGISYFFRAYMEVPGKKDSYYLETITGPAGINGRDWVKFYYTVNNSNALVTPTSLFQSKGLPINGVMTPSIFDSFLNKQTSTTNSVMYKVYPDYIETGKEKVKFSYGSRDDIRNAKKLDNITIFSKNGSVQTHSMNFGYEYFQESRRAEKLSMEMLNHTLDKDYLPKRLKLNEVAVNGVKHSFSYNETPLPYKVSLSQDFWGYYNGINNSEEFCATPKYKLIDGSVYEQVSIGKANRYASAELSQAGVLTKITYPTGGYTCFEYDINRFSDIEGYCYPETKYVVPSTNYSSSVTSFSDRSTSDDTNSKPTKSLGIVTIFPADQVSAVNKRYSSKTLDFVISGDEPEIITETLLKNGKTVVEEYMKVDLFFKGQTYSGYHRSSYPYCLKVFLRFYGTDAEGHGYDMQFSTSTESENFEKTVSLKLKRGTYHLYAQVDHIDNEHGSTFGYISANCKSKNPVSPSSLGLMSAQPETISVGAGLRIKTIKSYGQDGAFLGGSRYTYRGGKLLIPTVRAECMDLEYLLYESDIRDKVHGRCRFYFSKSHPSYPTICSFGSPTVGYSLVENESLDKNGSVLSKTVSEFENCEYKLFGSEQSLFFYPNQGSNGQLKKKTVYSPTGAIMSTVENFYGSYRYNSILYPVCKPKFVRHEIMGELDYNLVLFPKANIWHYLTKTIETQYVDGKPMTSVTTTYMYNQANYKEKEVRTSNGEQSTTKCFFYPMDTVKIGPTQLKGSQPLLDKNCISVPIAESHYLGNYFVGGKKFDYKMNGQIPVVDTCFSLYPNEVIADMIVTAYDEKSNIREYKTKDNIYTTIIWSYNYQFPVMQIVGAKYSSVVKKASNIASLGAKSSLSIDEIVKIHKDVSSLGCRVTSCIYDKWYGVSDIIAPDGTIMHYDRDKQGRLNDIRQNGINGPVMQNYKYNYLLK